VTRFNTRIMAVWMVQGSDPCGVSTACEKSLGASFPPASSPSGMQIVEILPLNTASYSSIWSMIRQATSVALTWLLSSAVVHIRDSPLGPRPMSIAPIWSRRPSILSVKVGSPLGWPVEDRPGQGVTTRHKARPSSSKELMRLLPESTTGNGK
jgi:hypothetical protein